MVYEVDEGDAAWGLNDAISDDHREVATLFKDLSRREGFKLCLSSRELPVFEDAFAGFLRVRVHDYTKDDIAQYASNRLSLPGLENSEKKYFVNQITIKST
ncbi:hypothetical protein B0H66DRAFT_531980 [Apodospora peruviana]|uniref:Uncharacterized protein n=1 Tax=Apodospora peruviana TaxID=516989 RepID=A0AAE0M7S9_9PEZI|nr:hypothetical protein B0H66DRAFT_531980 [Apodospora peruviana]